MIKEIDIFIHSNVPIGCNRLDLRSAIQKKSVLSNLVDMCMVPKQCLQNVQRQCFETWYESDRWRLKLSMSGPGRTCSPGTACGILSTVYSINLNHLSS